MIGRFAALAFSLLAGACAAVEPAANQGETAYVPDLLSSSGEWNTPGKVFSKALPVQISAQAFYHGHDALGSCDVEPEAFVPVLLDALKRHGVEADPHGPLLLNFDLTILDAPAGQCYLVIRNTLSAASINQLTWVPGLTFPWLTVLGENTSIYVSPPEHMAETFKSEADQQLRRLAPTISGKAEKTCGYFSPDPEEACEQYFRSALGVYKDAIGCMQTPEERGWVKKDYTEALPEFMEWLAAHPEAARMDSWKPPTGEVNCALIRSWVLKKHGHAP